MNVGQIGAQNTVISRNTFTGKNITMQANPDYSVDQAPTNDDSSTLLFISGISAIVLAVVAIFNGVKMKNLGKVIAENDTKLKDAQATITELKQAAEAALTKNKTTKESVSSIVDNVKNIVRKVFSKKKPNDKATTEAALKEVINIGESEGKKKSIFAPIKRFFTSKKLAQPEKDAE